MNLVVCGIVPSVWSFCNPQYVRSRLKTHYRNLARYLYCINLIWILLYALVEVLCQWGGIKLQFLAGQSAFLSCWLLSIMLVVVYNPWEWVIWLGIILFITVGYYFFLKRHLGGWNDLSFISLSLTIGAILIAGIISYKISQHKIKALLEQDT